MGGRGEPSDQKIRATQDQLRLARLTQDVTSVDDDRVNVQKLIKKVLETTRCSVSQAEIALYDTDNNVEEAVNLILEETYADDNVWKEQKSRKAKRAEAEERAEEQLAVHRSRNHAPRNASNLNGSNRARGCERGRGGFRGGARGRGRGGFHQSTAVATSNLWDNAQARPDPNQEWTSAAVNSVDELPEDTDWKTAGTLVFSRRDDVTPPLAASQPALSTSAGGATSSSGTAGGISFAAVAAARKQQPKHNHNLVVSSSVLPCEPTPVSSEQCDNEPKQETVSCSSPTPNPPVLSTPVATSTSADWTAQLKNDLGIGSVKTNPPPCSPVKHKPAEKQTSVARPLVHLLQQQQLPHNTVEFVSGGDASAPSALPEYQFGFHVETGQECAQPPPPQPDLFSSPQAQAKPRVSNRSEPELSTDTAAMLSNGAVCDFSSQQQPKGSVQNANGVGLVPAHSMPQSRQGLSYADTSSMSYPSDNSRAVKPSLSLHQQQQAQHQLYTAAQIPYNSYQYLNMYSPVTGVRQDEAQYAAALVQYPFGVGQIDMSSLSTMLPPAALASQQASQPPPPVQPQHQRPDQHASYLDPKAYGASSTTGNSASLLGNQQQRDSTAVSGSAVAPPPGFSGPPSNMPTAAFTLPQPNHISSLFQMPPTYHPQLNQLPFSFMLPNVTNSAQHKLNHQMFTQQPVDEALSEQRLSSQQKVYQQMDKYGSAASAKDRLGTAAQATPPPQMYQPPQNYLSQQLPLHAHSKKTYGNAPQHWSQS